MYGLIVLVAAVAAVQGQSTNVQTCRRNVPLPLNTYIEGCINPPCLLPQGQDAVIHIVFKAPRTMPSMRTLAEAFMPPIPLPIPYPLMDNAVTCNFLTNSFCPVLEGEVLQYTLRMAIETIFPEGQAPIVEFRIVDHNSSPIVCVRVPIVIGPPVPA